MLRYGPIFEAKSMAIAFLDWALRSILQYAEYYVPQSSMQTIHIKALDCLVIIEMTNKVL